MKKYNFQVMTELYQHSGLAPLSSCLCVCCFSSSLVNLSYFLFPGIEDPVTIDTTIDQPGPHHTSLSSGPDQSVLGSLSGFSHSAG